MLTIETVKDGKGPCGYCTVGDRHDLCPGGVLNGDRKTVVLCTCTKHDRVVRCLACGNRAPGEVSPESWHCLDLDACEATREVAKRESLRSLYGDLEDPERTRTIPKSERPQKAPSKAARVGSCLCCGEPTKGGLFLPGHDARYLSRLVAEVKAGAPHGVTEQGLVDAGCSPAFVAKFNKRVSG